MDEKSLTDLLANLIPDAAEEQPARDQDENPAEKNNLLLQSLQVLAEQGGGALQAVVGDFLSGKGRLYATARSARSKKSAMEKVETFLTENLKVSPALAALIAPLVVNLLPALSEATQKPRRRRKTKPKTESSSSAKKPRKKPSSSSKPKPAASAKPKPSTASKPKPKPKKKPASSGKSEKKESKPKAKPKKSTRTPSGDILDSSAPLLD